MDRVINPYSPGAGVRPAELAGREDFRENARISIERLRRGLPAKTLLMVGLRGVGKTVLLDQMRIDAEQEAVQAVALPADGVRSLPSLLAPELRLMLLRLSGNTTARDTSIRALRALAGFARAQENSHPDLEVGLDFEPESGLADSGVLQQDMPALLESVGVAARHAQSAVVLFIDELQFVRPAEIAALTLSLQRCARRNLPVALIGAGLPQLRGQAGECEFLELGPLSVEAAARTLVKPAAALNVDFDDAAVANIVAATQCYPYFLQELAKQAWDLARASPITLQDTRDAAHFALAALDEKFFRVRFDRLTPAEKRYLRAMAELGAGPHRSGDIAAALSRPVTSVGPVRGQLIAKGMIWSPNHGETAFSAPRFDEYMRRTWPNSTWRS